MSYNCTLRNSTILSYPKRPHWQRHVLNLACPPIPLLRVGFVGLGRRGARAIHRFAHIEGVQVVALCDMEPHNLARTQKILADNGLPRAREYAIPQGWQYLCESSDIDLVYVCTEPALHADIALNAMQCGKHVAVEVPAVRTVEECWRIVETAEQTQRHCMMLENCCYDRFELATLQMAQMGLFGEIVHAEGAYIHDLRERYFAPRTPAPGSAHGEPQGFYNSWWLRELAERNGNLYSTHGLMPLLLALGIHRNGDFLLKIASMSSPQRGLSDYAAQRFGPNSPQATTPYRQGDVNTTLLQTAAGKTITLQYAVATPRPYSRGYTLVGTRGFAQKYPVPTLAFDPDGDRPITGRELDNILAEYEHPFVRDYGARALQVDGDHRGGIDFVLDARLVHCLRNGLPLDMSVYDAAACSCIADMSAHSVSSRTMRLMLPRFLR